MIQRQGSTQWPSGCRAQYPVKCGCEHPLVQGVQASVGKVEEEVLLSLAYELKTRTGRLNSLLGGKECYGKAGVSMSPASQSSNVAMRQQEKGAAKHRHLTPRSVSAGRITS